MTLEKAKWVLQRRQAHLLTLVRKDRSGDYNDRENKAISVVLMELRKLEAKVEVYERKTV